MTTSRETDLGRRLQDLRDRIVESGQIDATKDPIAFARDKMHELAGIVDAWRAEQEPDFDSPEGPMGDEYALKQAVEVLIGWDENEEARANAVRRLREVTK